MQLVDLIVVACTMSNPHGMPELSSGVPVAGIAERLHHAGPAATGAMERGASEPADHALALRVAGEEDEKS